jgi:hypothetical protein
MSVPDGPEVRPVTWGDADHSVDRRIGNRRKLVWEGPPLRLTRLQTFGAVLLIAGAVAGGLGALLSGLESGHTLACRLHWLALGCQ